MVAWQRLQRSVWVPWLGIALWLEVARPSAGTEGGRGGRKEGGRRARNDGKGGGREVLWGRAGQTR